MQNFMAIMAQLFWGVTIGALGSAFSAAAKAILVLAGIAGAGWWSLKRRRKRKAEKDD